MMSSIKQLVAFCILMENNGGIADKAPSYIVEKHNRCSNTAEVHLPNLLDSNNTRKYEQWLELWDRSKSQTRRLTIQKEDNG